MEEREKFLNQINKRITTLTEVGVDKKLLLDEVRRRGPSGVFITELEQVDIYPPLWEKDKEHIQRALKHIIPTLHDVAEEIRRNMPFECRWHLVKTHRHNWKFFKSLIPGYLEQKVKSHLAEEHWLEENTITIEGETYPIDESISLPHFKEV